MNEIMRPLFNNAYLDDRADRFIKCVKYTTFETYPSWTILYLVTLDLTLVE